MSPNRISVKICGITSFDAADIAVEEGADALGFVFFHKSPRNIAPDNARTIGERLPEGIAKVGVFVNEPLETLLDITERAGLTHVQLHGVEPKSLIEEMLSRDIGVIKGVFHGKAPGFETAQSLYVDHPKMMFLTECGKGKLPGGNAETWDFGAAKDLCGRYPALIAGGLSALNVEDAIKAAKPAGVDVSSGVESSPGKKDLNKIREFIKAVRKTECKRYGIY